MITLMLLASELSVMLPTLTTFWALPFVRVNTAILIFLLKVCELTHIDIYSRLEIFQYKLGFLPGFCSGEVGLAEL